MNIVSRPPIIDPPHRLSIIYNYLRTLLSKDIPFIYFINHVELEPHVSIHLKSIENKSITKENLERWIYKKISNKEKILKKTPKINFKLFTYKTNDGKSKYTDISIYRNGIIEIQLSLEENTDSGINDVINYVNNVAKIIKKINGCFLSKQKQNLLNVPELNVVNNEFVFSKYTSMQYYQTLNNFKTEEKLNFNNFLNFLNKYKPFVDTSFSESNKDIITISYNRSSNHAEKALIFEFISKEKVLETENERIIDLIIKNFGVPRNDSEQLLNEWYILKSDKQIAKILLKQPGISIKITKSNLYDEKNYIYKISIAGLKNLFLLQTSFSFIKNSIKLFFNPIKEEKILQKNINIDFGFKNNDLFDKINFNEPLKQDNNTNNTDNFLNSNKLSSNYSSSMDIDMTDESNLDPKIRLKCKKDDNKLSDKGICKDVCDSKDFRLRRLQKFVPEVTAYKPPPDDKPYSRHVAENRRPIIVTTNVYDNPKFDKKAITYDIKYKSSDDKEFSYICPEAWCPTCEIPIIKEKITNLQVKVSEKGDKCHFGICPNGNHQVLINEGGYKYPGFLTKTKTPSGLCIPACFTISQVNKVVYKRCLNIKDDENIDDIKYISRRDKLKLPEGRYGLLPKEIDLFLEQEEEKPGNLKNGFNSLIRKGVKLTKKDTFINCIVDCISILYNKTYTVELLLKETTSKLTKQLFQSLCSGLIKRIFKTQENYIDYLLNTDYIRNIFIWDLICRPNILTKEGFNIIIFRTHLIYCPYGQNPKDLYSYDKPTLLLFKFENTYEPIYNLSYENNKITLSCLQNSLEDNIKKTIDYAINGCSPFDLVEWNLISRENKKEEFNLIDTIKEVKDKFNIKLQITDRYSKTTAVVLDNNLYIPVKPSKVSTNYPYLETDLITTLDFKKTLELLEKVLKNTKLPVKPIYFINKNNSIIGIVLETNRIIPVKTSKISKTYLKQSNKLYYPNANSKNYNNKEIKIRNEKVNEYYYNVEGFERFKYEISMYLQTEKGTKSKEKLINYISEKDSKKIKKEIDNILNIIIANPKNSKKKIEEIIKGKDKKYFSNLLRKSCLNSSNKDDAFCVCSNNSCKLINYNIKNYTDILIDKLLRYPIEKTEILEGTLPIIDIKTSTEKI